MGNWCEKKHIFFLVFGSTLQVSNMIFSTELVRWKPHGDVEDGG